MFFKKLIILETAEDLEAVCLKFKSLIKTCAFPYFSSSIFAMINDIKQPFAGVFKNYRFNIYRVTHFHNVFNPILYGSIMCEKQLTKINIEVKANFLTKIIFALFNFCCLVGYVLAIINYSNKENISYLLISIATLFTILINAVLILFSLQFEAKK